MRVGWARTKPGRIAFAAGALVWLVGLAVGTLTHSSASPLGAFLAYLAYMAFVAPAGAIVAAIGLGSQPTSGAPTIMMLFVIPSLINGVACAAIVELIVWARTKARPLFLGLFIGLVIYSALFLGFVWLEISLRA